MGRHPGTPGSKAVEPVGDGEAAVVEQALAGGQQDPRQALGFRPLTG
ncbi:MAG: hypothetical protein IH993_06260 [Proteobacteria bacterium]|nr:hypothetical protein [Pseudomonadota bacterium]